MGAEPLVANSISFSQNVAIWSQIKVDHDDISAAVTR